MLIARLLKFKYKFSSPRSCSLCFLDYKVLASTLVLCHSSSGLRPKKLDRLVLTLVLAHVVVRHISSPGGVTSHWQLATPRADFSNRHLPQNLTLIIKP
jgi:hypothetical protein